MKTVDSERLAAWRLSDDAAAELRKIVHLATEVQSESANIITHDRNPFYEHEDALALVRICENCQDLGTRVPACWGRMCHENDRGSVGDFASQGEITGKHLESLDDGKLDGKVFLERSLLRSLQRINAAALIAHNTLTLFGELTADTAGVLDDVGIGAGQLASVYRRITGLSPFTLNDGQEFVAACNEFLSLYADFEFYKKGLLECELDDYEWDEELGGCRFGPGKNGYRKRFEQVIARIKAATEPAVEYVSEYPEAEGRIHDICYEITTDPLHANDKVTAWLKDVAPKVSSLSQRAARKSKSAKGGKRGRPSTLQACMKLEKEYREGLEGGRWETITEFAKFKRAKRSTISKRLTRAQKGA